MIDLKRSYIHEYHEQSVILPQSLFRDEEVKSSRLQIMHDPQWSTNEWTPRRTQPLIKERGLLFRSPRLLRFPQRIITPEVAEQLDSRRAMSRVVIVGKCQNHDSPLLDLLEKIDPLGKVTLAINNHLVPSCRFFFDPFPVPQPPNVSEVRRD